MEQARAVVRMLESQVEEARADKSAIWEQTRADARAMAQVAKNIEGNQGVLAGVVTTLEAQLEAAHKEKDGAMEALRNERKLVERLTREHERQLRDAERQRDRAQAAADEAAKGRKTAQEALDAARREKKALFANLFAGACAALGAQPSAGGAPRPAWCDVTLSHMRAIGRRYVRELSIETLEMVVEGSDVDTAVQAQLFEPLKQLTAYLS